MPTTFRPYDPDQLLLLPPSLQDWLPEGHLAEHVSDLVDGLDLSAFYARYEGDGRRKSPYEPRMMLKVLIYGYATGVCSSRGLARKLEEDVAFRVLAAGNFPRHRTLSMSTEDGAFLTIENGRLRVWRELLFSRRCCLRGSIERRERSDRSVRQAWP